MNQSQFFATTCNSLEAREKSRVHGAIGFCFDSHWLKNSREAFKPITKRSNRNHVITFDVLFQKRVRGFHQGSKREKTFETTRPQAEWFYCLRAFGNLMKPEARVFEITSQTH